jgi:AraC family transcriptional regulator, transcriptional activator of pobA
MLGRSANPTNDRPCAPCYLFSDHLVDEAPPFQYLATAPPLYPFSQYRLGAAEAIFIRPWEEGFSDPRSGSRPHRHDFYQIFYMRAGARLLNIDFRQIRVQSPSLIFVPPGSVHFWGSPDGTLGFMLSFREESLQGQASDLFRECPPFDPAQYRAVLPISSCSVKMVDFCFKRISEEFANKAEGYESAHIALLRLLFVEIRRSTQRHPSSRPTQKYSGLVVRFLRLLSSRPYRVTSASQVARSLGASRSWLNQLVRRETGTNLTEHLQRRLILESKRLLAHSDLNVSEIAYQLGFRDASYFTRLFRQAEQVSPREFRERYR